MTSPRIVFTERQPEDPFTERQQDLDDLDLSYLLAYLDYSRKDSHRTVARPDQQERKKPAPDYLVQAATTGDLIAVEHTRVLLEDQQANKAYRIKQGALAVVYPFDTTPSPEQLRCFLRARLGRKLAKGQLSAIQAQEKILLARGDNLVITPRTLADVKGDFGDLKSAVDHIFLIVSRQLWEL